MPIETYTYVGFQFWPITWILPALLLALIPISRYRLGRIIPGAVIVPVFGFLIALIGVPGPYNVIIDMLAMSYVTFVIINQASSKEPKTVSVVTMFIPMAILFPNAVFMMFRDNVLRSVKLTDRKIDFVFRSRTVEIPRSTMRIEASKTWGQDFSDNGDNPITIDNQSVYWDGESLQSGSELAKRISEWSGATPRHSDY